MKKYRWLAFLAGIFCFFPCAASCERQQTSFCRYDVVAEYRPSDCTVAGSVKVTFENPTENELSDLRFHLYPNAYRKDALYKAVSPENYDAVYYAGESYGGISVSSVVGGTGWQVAGDDENTLVVYLEKPLAPSEKVVVDVAFTTKLPLANHRLGVTERAVNFGGVFPTLCGLKDGAFYQPPYTSLGDPFYADCADYRVEFSLPKEYVLAHGGECVEEKTLERKTKRTLTLENARDFALVASEDFEISQTVLGKTTIDYYHYSDDDPSATLETLKRSVEFFSAAFGEYPYPRYAVAETGLSFGGMEYSAFAMLSQFSGENRARNAVHETAHQWWGSAVGSDQTTEAWQDEGLAEYASALFFDKYGEYGLTKERVVADALEEYRSYYRSYGAALGWSDTRMSRPLHEYLSEYEYRVLTYDKGLVMFNALEQSVGSKKMLTALRKYYAENKFSMVTKESLFGAFERAGVDVAGFFDGFLQGKTLL